MKTLALALAISTPALATEGLVKLVAKSSTPEPRIQIKAGEQLSIVALLVNSALPRDQVSLSVRYPGVDDSLPLERGDHVSGPATVSLTFNRRTGREIAVAECVWVYNAFAASAPLQSLAIQRSEDASTWSTIRTFEDWSTNAFYRWKIEPRE